MGKKKRTRNIGRHYAADEWVEFILHGFAESEGVDEDEVEITDDLEAEVEHYTEEVERAIASCSKRFPPAQEIPADADTAYELYQTLVEAGVGISDYWESYYPNYMQKDWDKLADCYKERLGKFADFAGGGSLNEAFHNAVYAALPDPFREPDVVVGEMSIWYGPGDTAYEIESITTVEKDTVTQYDFLGGYEMYVEGEVEWREISTHVGDMPDDEIKAAVGVQKIGEQGGDEDLITTEDLIDQEVLPPDGMTWQQWKKSLRGKSSKSASTSQLKNKLLR